MFSGDNRVRLALTVRPVVENTCSRGVDVGGIAKATRRYVSLETR